MWLKSKEPKWKTEHHYSFSIIRLKLCVWSKRFSVLFLAIYLILTKIFWLEHNLMSSYKLKFTNFFTNSNSNITHLNNTAFATSGVRYVCFADVGMSKEKGLCKWISLSYELWNWHYRHEYLFGIWSIKNVKPAKIRIFKCSEKDPQTQTPLRLIFCNQSNCSYYFHQLLVVFLENTLKMFQILIDNIE